jgi:gluconolactonase
MPARRLAMQRTGRKRYNSIMRPAIQFVLLAALSLPPLLAQPKGGFTNPAPPKEVTVTAIPGVIAAGAKWTLVWKGNENADGIAGTNDGGLLFAQEQLDQVSKLDKNGKYSAFLTNAHGPGAVSIGPKNRILVVERTCTDPGGHKGGKPAECTEPTDVAALTPERKILASSFSGKGFGRVNDLVADKKGGVYFTSGGAFYISPSGQVSSVGENLRTNGITLSPDEKTLYITNGPTVAAFDVQPDGSVKNQREFGKLQGGGDGMAIDSMGRLYVTTPNVGIGVLAPDGKYLGTIPTPRTCISVAFSGPGKKTLYVAMLGAVGPDGQEIKTTPAVRNNAMSLYTIPMIAQGFKGRPR